MQIPPLTDARWAQIASGKISKPWSSLAMKIMMARVLRETAQDKTPGCVNRNAAEIHAFFSKNLSVAEADFRAVFG